MILADRMNRQNQTQIDLVLALLLGGLFGRTGWLGFFPLASPVGALFLRSVVRARLFFVVAASMAEKEQDWLRVFGSHAPSFRSLAGSRQAQYDSSRYRSDWEQRCLTRVDNKSLGPQGFSIIWVSAASSRELMFS